MSRPGMALTVSALALVLAGDAPAHARATPQQKCEAAKLKLVAREASCELGIAAKAGAGFSKCSNVFSTGFGKLKTTCDGDQASLENRIDAFRAGITTALTPVSNKCEAGKIKATGKKQACELGIYGKSIVKGTSPDVGSCTSTLAADFTRLERGKARCAVTADAGVIEDDVAAFVGDVFALVTGSASTTTTTVAVSTTTTTGAAPTTTTTIRVTTTTTTHASTSTTSTTQASTSTTSTIEASTTTTITSSTTSTTTSPVLAVLRAGDGTEDLSVDAAVSMFIDELNVDGTSAGASIALPTAASGSNHPFTEAGAETEGMLSRSEDGHYLAVAGYAAVPGTAGVSATEATSVQRVVARIDAAGRVDTSTLLGTSAYTANNIRGVTTVDGGAFWISGAGKTDGGVWYATLGGGTVTQVEIGSVTSVRAIEIFAGQLFASGNSTGFKQVFTVGTGLPTTSGQTAVDLPGMSDASPFAFLFLDLDPSVPGLDTLYVADNTAFPSPPGGIQKWTFNGTTWTMVNVFATGLSNPVRGLTGFVSGTNVTLAATTNEATANNVVVLVDDGSASPTATTIATAPAGTQFRGVALAPQ